MLQERIEILKEEIRVRKEELKELTTKLLASETDIQKRFHLWATSGLDAHTDGFVPGGAINIWVKKHADLRRYETLNFFDREEFAIFAMSPEEIIENDFTDYVNNLKNDELFLRVCEQMIEENIDSFTFDW